MCTRPASQIADGMGSIGRRLLVAHADVFYASLLGFGGDLLHGKSDDPEHVVDALLLQALRH